MKVAKLLRIQGLVQGVYYRESMRTEANRLQITGWVRNRKDGTVEAFVQGDESSLEEMIRWCQRGPERAKVTSVEVSTSEIVLDCIDFQRRPTE